MKLITTTEANKCQVKIYFNNDCGEYQLKIYINGDYQKNADYFTDCKQDAIKTAQFIVSKNYIK